ncbi:MAG: M16 family metallopeptidase [Desulfovibrio sp.]|uniref:M16 family metallopeptidase n=1 Tax=Desulfovibrio sp. 7SRBS1 TaxID=3378064 RepID=UPI003B4033DC
MFATDSQAQKPETGKTSRSETSCAANETAVSHETTAGPQVTVLENGLTVLTLEDDRFPLVSTRLYVHAGSAYETPKQAGISHILEHMVFKGTANRGPGQVARDVESAGGSLNAATSFDYTVYYVDVPAASWKLALDVTHDMIFNALLDPKELESELDVIVSELRRGQDEPGSRMFKILQSEVWPHLSYRWPIIGFEDTIRATTSEDLRTYIQRMYQPQSMLLVAVGDIKSQDVVAEARRLYGNLKNTRDINPPSRTPLPEPTAPVVHLESGQWNKVYLGMALPLPGLDDAGIPAMEVLAQIMGGDKSSRLYREFKYEKRLVDDIWATSFTMERGGMFMVRATLDAENVVEFWSELMQLFSGLEGLDFTDDEIRRAKLGLEDSLYQSKETLAGLASKIGYFQFFEGGQDAEERYLYGLRNTGPDQLHDIVSSYFLPGRLRAAVLVPEGTDLRADTLENAVADQWPGKSSETAAAEKTTTDETRVVDVPGGKIVFRPDPTLPYTAMSIVWPGGDGLLPADKQGLAELTAELMHKGTTNRSATQLQDYLADCASDFNVSAGRDTFSLTTKFPCRFANEMLDLIREVLTDPAFSEQEADRARQEQIAAIKQREDRPMGLAFRKIFPFLYKDTGYSYLHMGETEAIAGFTAEQARTTWDRQKKQPFVLSVCGTFDTPQVKAVAQTLAELQMADGQMAETKPYAFSSPHWNTERELDLNLPGREQAHLLRIFPVPGSAHADSTGLSLLRDILAGQSGLLFRDLRDKEGLGYTVTAIMWQAPETGFFAFYIGTSPDKVDAALQGFDRTQEKLRTDPLPQEELDRAVNLLRGDYFREHQSLSSRASEAARLLAKNLPMDHYRELPDRAEKLTPEDLRKLAARYLDNAKAYLIKVEP